MTDPIIRPATRDDIPALQTVVDETGLFPSEMLRDVFAPALNGGSEAFLLAGLVEGAVAGLCFIAHEEMTDGTWNMLALAVRPDAQSKGLGAALVKAAEAHLKQAGQRILIVDTSGTDAFARTRGFYVKNGYTEEARIRDFWASGDDKVTFRKALRP